MEHIKHSILFGKSNNLAVLWGAGTWEIILSKKKNNFDEEDHASMGL